MPEDKLAGFLARRIGRTEDRPIDRLATILRGIPPQDPTKLKHNTPDHVPKTPDGNKPTIARPKKRTPSFGPGM